jgi:hypothetical protein
VTEAENAEILELKAEIGAYEDGSIKEIPFELLEKKGNRTTKLVATSGEVEPIDGRRRWHDFKFRAPFFITKIEVDVTGYGEFGAFGFKWVTEEGKEREAEAKPTSGVVKLTVNDICRSVSFRPPSVIFASTKIKSVRIEGIERDDIPSALDSLSDLDSFKGQIIAIVNTSIDRSNKRVAEANAAANTKALLEKEITAQKQSVSRLKKSIDDLSHKKNELIVLNGEASRALAESETRNSDVNDQFSLVSKKIHEHRKEISDKETLLRELKSNINLFPTEIVDFVNQGSKNVRQYFWLAAAPIAIIVGMFIMLVEGAANLTTIITTQKDINITAIMLSRVPYVTVATVIITACYKIARAFFNELIRINSQRLNLTKISIIAKDVSSASERELNMTDEEVYRLRTEMKMRLLGDHLKDYISKDVKTVMPTKPFDFLPGSGKDETIE